jgi:hypothetical protein
MRVEIGLRRRSLSAYIAADPIEIVFTRYPRIDDGAGGWRRGTPVEVGPQIMRLVPYKRRLSSLTDMVTAGEIPNVQYSLLALYDADVQRYDEFQLRDEWMKVVGVEPKSSIPEMSDRLTVLIEIRDKAT